MSPPIIPSFSIRSCVRERIPPGLVSYIYRLHTLVRSKTVSVRLRVIFTGYTHTHSLIHTHTTHTLMCWTQTRARDLGQCNSAPLRQELATPICQQGDGRVSIPTPKSCDKPDKCGGASERWRGAACKIYTELSSDAQGVMDYILQHFSPLHTVMEIKM